MFENIANFFKRLIKSETKETPSKETAKERLHLVLMQDRANVSADFLELMKQEIIEVIKKYIEVEDSAIDVRLTNEVGEDGKQGAPSLYANIPILNIKNNIKNENTTKEVEAKENKDNLKEDTEKKGTEQKNSEETDKAQEVKQEDKTEKDKEQVDKKENEKEVKEENKEEQLEESSINETETAENKSQEKTSESKIKLKNDTTAEKKNSKK